MQTLLCGRLLFGHTSNLAGSLQAEPLPVGLPLATSRKSLTDRLRVIALAVQLAIEPQTMCLALKQWNIPIRLALVHARRSKKRRYRDYLNKHLVEEFWGGARGQPPLQRLLHEVRNYVFKHRSPSSGSSVQIFIDVGAASYEGPDVSHALEIAQLWGCCRVPPVVLALEPLHSELQRTRESVSKQLLRHPVCSADSSQLADIRWLQVAASNVTGVVLPLRGVRNQASLSLHIPSVTSSLDYPPMSSQETTTTVRLDDLLVQQNLVDKQVMLVKLDTEGHDWEVLLGAASLLQAQQIEVLVFELAGQMNPDFFALHKEQHSNRRAHVVQRLYELRAGLGTPTEVAKPNLHSIVEWLAAHGYAAMLLGRRRLLPLSGDWWSDEFEVCIARLDVPCWYDVVAFPYTSGLLKHILKAW